MDEQLAAESAALREMFQTDGWRVLMRNTQGQLEAFQQGFPFNVNNLEQLYFARGMMASLKALLGMEDQLEAVEQAAQQADE